MFGFFKSKNSSSDSLDKVASLSSSDAALDSFKKHAQDELYYLIEFMQGHEKDDELFKYAVKVDFIEKGKSEHMWVQVNEFSNGVFKGKLANHPNTIQQLKHGDDVEVKREDVEDWILQDHLTGTKVGGFSSNYIRSKAENK